MTAQTDRDDDFGALDLDDMPGIPPLVHNARVAADLHQRRLHRRDGRVAGPSRRVPRVQPHGALAAHMVRHRRRRHVHRVVRGDGMRTVKASEVRKGMRVEASKRNMANGGSIEIGGLVSLVLPDEPTETVYIEWDHQVSMMLTPDHPVTVLAEPEPEWVDGAWYWIDGGPMIRRVNGWHNDPTDKGDFPDLDDSEVDSASVKRVLIVDWPGDDVARELDAINDGNRSTSLSNYGRVTTHDTILRNVADAIRTQGGAR